MSDARPHQRVEIEGEAWDVFEAWRAPSGLGLVYFVRATREEGDRRAEVDPGTRFEDLDASRLAEMWQGASSLTESERRLVDGEGEVWLLQAEGPVWGEGGAADAVGTRARCLTATRDGVVLRGVRPDDGTDEDWDARLRPAPAHEDEAAED